MNYFILTKFGLTVTLQTNTTAKLVPVSTKCIIATFKLNTEPVSQTIPIKTGMYFNFIFSAGSSSPKSCTTALF